jgi:transcriptional regulator with XRE-family HTH domain
MPKATTSRREDARSAAEEVRLDPLGIGPRIRYWHQRRGIPRAAFAGLIGRSKSWVEMAETGQRAPYRIDDLAQIATALRVDLGTLLCEPIPEQAGDQQQRLLGTLRDAFQRGDPTRGLAEIARRLSVTGGAPPPPPSPEPPAYGAGLDDVANP